MNVVARRFCRKYDIIVEHRERDTSGKLVSEEKKTIAVDNFQTRVPRFPRVRPADLVVGRQL